VLISSKVQVETAIQADPLEPENSQVSNEVSMSEPNLDVDGKQDGEMISKGDLDVAGPRAVSGKHSINPGATKFKNRNQLPHSPRLRSLLPSPSPGNHNFPPDDRHESGGHRKHMKMPPCGNPRRQRLLLHLSHQARERDGQ
jgi:hypothetical protein